MFGILFDYKDDIFYDHDKHRFKDGWHYISWANAHGMTFTGAYIRFTLGLNDDSTYHLCEKINRSHETGTLYPKANMTLMPIDSQDADEDIYEHFNDALKAQNIYVNAHNIVFDMRHYEYCKGNGDYVYMIKNAYNLSFSQGQNQNWYVLLSNYYRDNKNDCLNYSYALRNYFLDKI